MSEMNIPSTTALRQVYTAAYEAEHGTYWQGAEALVDNPMRVEDTSLGITTESLREAERVLFSYADATQRMGTLDPTFPNQDFNGFDLDTAQAAMTFLSEALANDEDGVLLRDELDTAYAEATGDPNAMVFPGMAADLEGTAFRSRPVIDGVIQIDFSTLGE